MDDKYFKELRPSPQKGLYSSEHVVSGISMPKTKRIESFSPDEWEEFTEEYAYSLIESYQKVLRFGGAGDKGLDVVGFINGSTFADGWDNYQCKFYGHALYPSDVWLEFGKIIYFSFIGDYTAPRKYYFVAPKGIGTTLSNLLSRPDELKKQIRGQWDEKINTNISTTFDTPLSGELLDYFDTFDFSIFDSSSLAELVIGHSKTPFHAVRFGGGLAMRPESDLPPEKTASNENIYIKQLLYAYGDCEGKDAQNLEWLESNKKYKKNFQRQRERFYHAESLRNFSRDNVPLGTFEKLQEDVYQGVIDVCESDYKHGFERMTETVKQAAQLSIDSSPLKSVTGIADKQGICHQLVNNNDLKWVEDKDE